MLRLDSKAGAVPGTLPVLQAQSGCACLREPGVSHPMKQLASQYSVPLQSWVGGVELVAGADVKVSTSTL